MSRENVEIVRACFEAYLRGDREAARAALHPEVEFDQTLRPDGKVFHGLPGVVEALSEWRAGFDSWTAEVEGFLDGGDRVLIIGRQSGRAKATGMEIGQPFAHVVTVRSGKIVHWKGYLDRAEALKAAGLSE